MFSTLRFAALLVVIFSPHLKSGLLVCKVGNILSKNRKEHVKFHITFFLTFELLRIAA